MTRAATIAGRPLSAQFWIILAVAFLILAVGMSIAMIQVDFFEWMHEYTRAHEEWELDEIILVAVSVLISLALVASTGTLILTRNYLAQVDALIDLERQLAESRKQQALGTLIGGAAHTINNYLQPIQTLGRLARDAQPDGSEEHRDMEQLLAATRGAAQVVRELLTFARKSETVDVACEIDTAIRETSALARVSIPSSIDLVVTTNSANFTVALSQDLIQTIVLSLISNSVAAIGSANGSIEIGSMIETFASPKALMESTLEPGTYALLCIADTGKGMNEETRRRAIEPFFTTKEVGKGTGLGISVVNGIVTQAGGGLSIESQVDVGTTVKVHIPIRDTRGK